MKFQAETWRELGTLEVLAGMGLRVLAVDMPGFGKSPASEAQPVEILARFFARQGLDRAILIGPSMGGRIALEFAIGHPQRIAGLVLVGAVGVAENRTGLAAITSPSLIVWGGDDQISPLANSEILLTELKNAQREIYPGAPHPCYLTQPDRWHASLRAFFTNLYQ
jgi:abhydrolase domain-containing protein 14